MFVNHSFAETPTPGEAWSTASQINRLDLVRNALNSSQNFSNLVVLDCKSNGEVYLEMRVPMSSNQRGTLLLDAEATLKNQIDDAITIWLEPLGDKSTLRNLRGVKVKITRGDSRINPLEDKHRE